jgi:ATP synthase protein I
MDDKSLETRSDELAKKLQAIKDRKVISEAVSEGAKTGKGYAEAMRYTTDFVSGPIVGAILGYAIDKLFNSSPWGLLIMLLLGFAAGVLNIYKTSERNKNG